MQEEKLVKVGCRRLCCTMLKVEARPPKENDVRTVSGLMRPSNDVVVVCWTHFDVVHFSILATIVVFAAVIVVVGPSLCPLNLLNTLDDVEPEALQRRFELNFSCWSGQFLENGPQVSQ